jgi:hypothetical protein
LPISDEEEECKMESKLSMDQGSFDVQRQDVNQVSQNQTMMAEEKNRKMVEIETIERGAENVPVNFMIVDTRHE